ncbi:deoxyribose-phosphate aldolase [Aneurinibacillus terranovensis]|uniref:deoxyribose-phosphate aldolase n=1 Tax=Aneurinibacillus terranovensis TaxID=278991 RepID=UPI000416C773|nr:deoxyribose-phosphate aldolase [Aneurinibacillus terranovensis]
MRNLSSYIDHTLLKQEATSKDIEKLCDEARQFKFASVCINPHFVSLATKWLQGSEVKVCTVIGFPLGANTTTVKVSETEDAIRNGASEIDMVINIGALKEKNDEIVFRDIAGVVNAAKGKTVKVIIETCLLTEEEKRRACMLSKEAGAHFVKTSTGFSTGGAIVEDVELMKATVGDKLEVKASGGIRDQESALKMIKAGATRIGTSNGVKIVTDDTTLMESTY